MRESPEQGRGPSQHRMPSLDGLRALAVFVVLAYHAGMPWARGGFLGVDVFFVLSGYLITSLLLGEWHGSGTIALRAFWSRRARRLLPALVLLLLGVAAYARLTVPGDQLSSLRRDALATLGYFSNWHFILARRSYFARSAAPSLLQHTWSLAIEEQFYLVWPVVVLLVLRMRRRLPSHRAAKGLLVVAGAGTVASAAAMAALFRPGTDPSRVYFGTDTHAQSVLTGATLAIALFCWAQRAQAVRRGAWEVAGGAGLVVAAWACITTSAGSSQLYRGGFLALDVAAAALVASLVLRQDSLMSRALAVGPLRYVGAISYGLYLWHWPVFLAVDHDRTGFTGAALLLARVSATAAISICSYHLVEMPVRRGKFRPTVKWVSVPAVTALAVLAIFTATATRVVIVAAPVAAGQAAPETSSTGLSASPKGGALKADPLSGLPLLPPLPPRHRLSAAGPTRILLEGDSIALSLGFDWGVARGPYDVSVLDKGSLGCGVAQSTLLRDQSYVHPPPPWCATQPESWATDVGIFDPDVAVVLVGRWEVVDRMFEGHWTHIGDPAFDALIATELQNAVLTLSARGAPVVLLTMPCMSSGEQPDGTSWPQDDPQRIDRFNALLRAVAARSGGRAQIIDLKNMVCPGGRFTLNVGGVNVRTSDGLHFSHPGSIWLAPLLVPQFVRLAKRA